MRDEGLRTPVRFDLPPARALLLILAANLFVAAAAAQALSVADDRGKSIELAQSARRIVALAPSLVELSFAAGAGNRIVGAARYSDYPIAARAIPRIGDAARVDFERVVALRPDLVLAWRSGTSQADVARLEQIGLPVHVSEPARLTDIPRLIRAIGRLAGTAPAAETAASGFERTLDDLRARHAASRPVRVFYEIWHQPLLTVSGAHIISDVIEACGGRNVFADVAQLTPAVSLEAVIVARPEIVLGGGSAGGEAGFVDGWRKSPVPALRNLPLRYVDPDLIQRQTPRILEGAKTVCAALDNVRANRRDAGTAN